jgi:hypothetical protein
MKTPKRCKRPLSCQVPVAVPRILQPTEKASIVQDTPASWRELPKRDWIHDLAIESAD